MKNRLILCFALLASLGALSGCGGGDPVSSAVKDATGAQQIQCEHEGWIVFVGERETVHGCGEKTDAGVLHARCYVVIDDVAQDVTDRVVDSEETWPCAADARAEKRAAEERAARAAAAKARAAAAAEAKRLARQQAAAERAIERQFNYDAALDKGTTACINTFSNWVLNPPRGDKESAAVAKAEETAARFGSTPTERRDIRSACLQVLIGPNYTG